MNEIKTQNRLSRQEAFQIMEWLKANRTEMEMQTSSNVIKGLVEAGMRSIPVSVLIGMRKDLGWADRRNSRQNNEINKLVELENRIEALEAFAKSFHS